MTTSVQSGSPTTSCHREIHVGRVVINGKNYEAVIIYEGDEASMPAAFKMKSISAISHVYRWAISEMAVRQQEKSAVGTGRILQINTEGFQFLNKSQVAHAEVSTEKIWDVFIRWLDCPSEAYALKGVLVSNQECQLIRGIIERICQEEQGESAFNYKEEEKRLLLRLGIEPLTTLAEPEKGYFLFSLLKGILDFEKYKLSELDRRLPPTQSPEEILSLRDSAS